MEPCYVDLRLSFYVISRKGERASVLAQIVGSLSGSECAMALEEYLLIVIVVCGSACG